jgi:hypothetical protein
VIVENIGGDLTDLLFAAEAFVEAQACHYFFPLFVRCRSIVLTDTSHMAASRASVWENFGAGFDRRNPDQLVKGNSLYPSRREFVGVRRDWRMPPHP